MHIGAIVHVIQRGTGLARFLAGGEAQLEIMEGFLPQTSARFASISALKVAPNTWRIHGNVALAPNATALANGGALSSIIQTSETAIRIGTDHKGAMIETTAVEPVTVLATVDASIPVGAVVRIAQMGEGAVHLAADSEAKLLHCGTRLPMSSGRNGIVILHKTAADTWRVSGDLALVHAFA
jgi:hypothetical protein